MRDEIILIGPARTGKTTVARLLAAELGQPQVSLDELRWGYYAEIGYDPELARRIRQTGGFVALVFYWKLFDAHAVERVLADHRDCIFDFGGGHSIYENRHLLARVQQALAPFRHVILILPSPDAGESIRVLDERTADLTGAFGQGFNWNDYFVRHPTKQLLATHTVYTWGKTAEETRDEILALIGQTDT